MKSLIKSSVRHKGITFLFVLLIVCAGIYSYYTLPQNEDPKITPDAMQIFAFWPGATPEEIELYLTKPLESAITKQDYVSSLETESLPGVATAVIRLSSYINEDKIKRSFQDIRNYINDAKSQFPPDCVFVINDRFGETDAYVIALSSESGNRTFRELKAIMEKIKDELRTVEGSGDYKYFGNRPEKIYVNFSSEDLSALSLNPYFIASAIQTQNSQMVQSKIDISGKEILIEVTGNYENLDQLRDTIIYTDKDGKSYTIRDLKGNVNLGYDDPPARIVRVNGQKSLIMTLSMKRGFHIVKWGKKIDKQIERIRHKLPSDVKLKIVFNQPKGVDHAVKNFMFNFIQSVMAVIIVLGIGLGIRNAGIVSISIPLIILSTFAMMKVFGIELHQMSINALVIALGMVVDNSVVVIDNINRYLDMGFSKVKAAMKGTVEVLNPLFWGTLIAITAFTALTLMPGALGQYVGALPRVISMTLVASFFTASLLIPTLAVIFLAERRKKGGKKGFFASLFGKKKKTDEDEAVEEDKKKLSLYGKLYSGFVNITQRFKFLTVLVLLALVGLAGFLMATDRIPTSFFPPADKTQLIADIFLPNGYNIYSTNEKVKLLEKKLQEMQKIKIAQPGDVFNREYPKKPIIKDYAAYVGEYGPRFFIAVKPRAPKVRTAHIMMTTYSGWHSRYAVREIRKFVSENISGARVDVKLLELGVPVDYPVEILVTGSDTKVLREIGSKLETILADAKGVTSVENNFGTNSQKLVVRIDQKKAKALGFNSNDISRQIYGFFQGAPVSRYKAPERRIDIVLRLREQERKNLADLKATLFTSQMDGQKHRLDEFAEVYYNDYPSAIMRKDERRTLTVGARIDENTLAFNVLKEVRPLISKVEIPEGYSISYGGQEKESKKAFGDLIPLGFLAMVVMLIILSVKFKSVKIAMSIYMSIPMAITGAIFGLYLTKLPLGFMASLGMLSLIGIVIYNAIVMVEFIQNRLKESDDAIQAIKDAGIARTRPILLTTITTLGGLLPLALSKNPLFEPLCWVIIYGLGFSTIMTLLITPLWFVLFGGIKDTRKNFKYEEENKEEAAAEKQAATGKS